MSINQEFNSTYMCDKELLKAKPDHLLGARLRMSDVDCGFDSCSDQKHIFLKNKKSLTGFYSKLLMFLTVYSNEPLCKIPNLYEQLDT